MPSDKERTGEHRDAGRVLIGLRELAEEAGIPDVVTEAEEALARLRESRFHLAVMGQYKRGKSTLINALLGEPVLPTGVLPLTSIATELKSGPRRRAEVIFSNGRREEVPIDDLALYCTEKHNPQNQKGVARVQVELPNPRLASGLVITDTPGIASTHAHNTRAAYDYLTHADAAVLVFGVDPPISEAESDFVERASGYLDRLFFLLNKVDYIPPNDRREALEFTRQVLACRLGERAAAAARLLPVSAKLALEAKQGQNEDLLRESGLPAFEAELDRFIAHSKAEAVVGAAARRSLRLAREIQSRLLAEQAALRLPLTELEGASAALTATLERGRTRHRETLFVLDGELKELERVLDERVDRFREQETTSLGRRAEGFLEGKAKTRLAPAQLMRELEEFRSRLLVWEFEAWRRELEADLNEHLRSPGQRFEEETSSLVAEVREQASEILRVKLPPVADSGRLSTESSLWYLTGDISKPFMPELNLLSFSAILPRAVVLGRLKRDLARSVAEEVDRNCGRVRYDVLVRLEKAGRGLQASLERRFEAAIQSLAQGLERARAVRKEGEERTAAALERVDRLLAEAARLVTMATQLVEAAPARSPAP